MQTAIPGLFRTGIVAALLHGMTAGAAIADDNVVPRYKPSSRSPEALDIRSNSYGASRDAPDALEIGDRVPDFTVPRAGGGFVSLREVRSRGPVAIIFYRGHW